jgi:hypothetical protein
MRPAPATPASGRNPPGSAPPRTPEAPGPGANRGLHGRHDVPCAPALLLASLPLAVAQRASFWLLAEPQKDHHPGPQHRGPGSRRARRWLLPTPKVDSPLPPYSAVRRTLHFLRTGAAEYAQYTEQLDNVRKQSTRAPSPALLWRRLLVAPPVTLRSLAKTFNVPLGSYSRYLRETYREWQQKSESSCTEACSCGRFATTITHPSAFFVDQAEVPDPNLDPGYKRLFPGHKVARGYSPPFEPAQQISETPPNQPTHPLQFLYPGAALSDWGRYLGASTGSSDELSKEFITKRLGNVLELMLPCPASRNVPDSSSSSTWWVHAPSSSLRSHTRQK